METMMWRLKLAHFRNIRARRVIYVLLTSQQISVVGNYVYESTWYGALNCNKTVKVTLKG
jgi:hypothetical protein